MLTKEELGVGCEINMSAYSKKITEILLSLGIYPKYAGFNYSKEAVLYAAVNPKAIGNLTKELYPAVAVRLQTSVSKIQSGIRNVLEVVNERGQIKKLNYIFGFTVVGDYDRITSGEFIALLSNELTFSKIL